jgi:hypothetical protein
VADSCCRVEGLSWLCLDCPERHAPELAHPCETCARHGDLDAIDHCRLCVHGDDAGQTGECGYRRKAR